VKTTNQADVDRDRDADEPGHHRLSGHEIRDADAKRMTKMGWLAVGAMTLVTLLALVLMRQPHGIDHGHGGPPEYQKALRDFRDQIMQVDVNDAEAVKHAREQIRANRSLWHGERIEPDIVSKLHALDVAFEKNVKPPEPQNLLDTPKGWQEAIKSESLKMSFGSQGLTLTNNAGEGASPGGVRYLPGTSWCDYVFDIDFKLDSGTMVIYTRVGEKMDLSQGPGFSIGTIVGTRTPDVVVEYGKPMSLTVSTIGNVLTVTSPDNGVTPYRHELMAYPMRRGEPGIELKAGTTVTITKVRARVLR